MAQLIFIGIVLVFAALLWRSRDSAGGRAAKRLLLLAFVALVVFTIAFPEVTTTVAGFIGIGRGADLVFYLTSFGLMLLAALTYLKFQRVDSRSARVTQEMALLRWELEVAREGGLDSR